MAGPFATVNGLPVVSGRLMIPLVGMWTADLELSGAGALQGAVTVIIGNMTLQGAVYRSSSFGGTTRVRLVAGAGGWRTVVPAQGYGNAGGVSCATVLNDVAAACGEAVNPPSGVMLGNAWTRPDDVASTVLWQLVAVGAIPSWYVDLTGTTQCVAWPASTISTPFTVTDQKPDEGLVVVATEDYASWVPGCSFSAPQLAGALTSAGVNFVWGEDGTFRLEVLYGTTDRFLGALAQFIQAQIAPTRFYGRYRYTISNPTSSTVDITPVNSKLGLPTHQGVSLGSDSIATYTPPDGGTCHVQFLDGDPAYPVVVWTSGTATVVNVLGGSNPVARLGDQVQVFLPPALPFVGVSSSGPVTGTITGAGPISGAIIQGSQEVNAS